MHNEDTQTITEITIKLPYINTVKDFVNTALKHSCAATLKSERYAVDAKSIMGVFSLDLSQPIKLILEPGNNGIDDRDDFLHAISEYIVA